MTAICRLLPVKAHPVRWSSRMQMGGQVHEITHLDTLNKYQPVAGAHEIISLLGPLKQGWNLAIWFASPDAHLEYKAPKDLIVAEPRDVMAAAMEELRSLRPD